MVDRSAVADTGSILAKNLGSFKINSAKKVASRSHDSVCDLWIARLSASGIWQAFVETDPSPIYLWSSEFSVVRGPLFYAAEKPEKSATGAEIGRDVQSGTLKTRRPGRVRTCLALVF
jgi:hypothetical protein